MKLQEKHLDFGAKLCFFLLLAGFIVLAYSAGGVDFRGYYGAATLVLRGGNPYDYGQLAPVLEEITGFTGNNPYFYPPWLSLLFVPFALLPFQVARFVWLALNGVLLLIALKLLQNTIRWQIDGWRNWLVNIAAALSFAVYCLFSEQAGILLLFFLALTLTSIKQERYALAGVALILFVSKPQVTVLVAIVIAIWLLAEQQRSFWWALFWAAALTIISSIAIPTWWQFDRYGFGAGLSYELDGPNQIEAVRVLSTIYDFSEYVLGLGPLYQYSLAMLAALFGFVLVFVTWRRKMGLYAVVSATIIFSFLVTPYTLQYDYTLLTLPFLYIVQALPILNRPLQLVSVILLFTSFSVLIWQEWSYEGYLQLVTFTGVFVLVLLAAKDNPAFVGRSITDTDYPATS